MVIKTISGMYEVIKNIREAYNEDKFNEAYLSEYFDSYDYIVGDIASETLRLKGFSTNPNNPNYFKKIPDYLTESCAYKGAYFILRRINNEDEYRSLYEKYKTNPNKKVTEGDYLIKTIEKVPFDKDTLSLESSSGKAPHIVLDMAKINSVKTYPLPDDLREEADEMKARDLRNSMKNNSFNRNKNNNNNNQRPNQNNQNKNNNNNNQKPNNQNNNQNKGNNNNQKKQFSNMNGNKKAFSNNKK